MYKMDLALNNQQWLICHKTKPTQNQFWLNLAATNSKNSLYIIHENFFFPEFYGQNLEVCYTQIIKGNFKPVLILFDSNFLVKHRMVLRHSPSYLSELLAPCDFSLLPKMKIHFKSKI